MISGPRTGVLFVCLGNICRSPLAEGIFIDLARRRSVLDRFEVDSCGIGAWHAGEGPDPRSAQIALRHGIRLEHEARQLDPRGDFDRFHLLVAMDRSNQGALLRAAATHGKDAARVRLMGSFGLASAAGVREEPDIPDPYYGGDEGFARVFDMLSTACGEMLNRLLDGRA